MSTRQKWRNRGYHVLCRHGMIYLHNATDGRTWSRPIDNGRWMEFTDLTDWREVTATLTPCQRHNIASTVRDCYCGSGDMFPSGCDFCTSTRTPDGAAWYVIDR